MQKILFCFVGSALLLPSAVLLASEPFPTAGHAPLKENMPGIAPLQFSVGAFTFERPSTWKWMIPSSSMRKAQLEIPGKPPGEITFFHFGPGQGGSVQANVDRWAAQFTSTDGFPVSATTSTQEMNNTRITFVSAHGTFASGMPGGPTQACSNYALRGAILENPLGNVYVKMTGPEELVKQATLTFDKMVLSEEK